MTLSIMENVSSNMKELRKKLKISQEDIALKLGVTRPVISNWERGVGEPSTSQLAKLAQELKISIDLLVSTKSEGKRVAVVDTSLLLKRPVIIEEIVEKFDEIIIPQVVIDELNYHKDNGKPWLKRQAALIMHYIDDIISKKEKQIDIVQSKSTGGENDVQIANIAIERAKEDFCDKIYVFANDILFSFLVKEKLSNLFLLTYTEYKDQFLGSEGFYNMEETQRFMSLLKDKNWERIELMECDSEIDINYVDPETGLTPLIQIIRHKNHDGVDFLIKKYKKYIDLDLRDEHRYKFTPLLHTAQLGMLETMSLLVYEGADIDLGSKGNNDGNTPLMVSAYHGFHKCVKFLVERGACLNQQDGKNGFTALMKACMNGHLDAAKLLIEGTDVSIRSRIHNKKAVEYINPNKKNSAEMYKLFKEKK